MFDWLQVGSVRFSVRFSGRGNRSGGDDLASGMMMVAGVIVLVIVVLLIWVIVQAVVLVIRAWHESRGKSRQLRMALAVWGIALLLELASAVMTGARTIPLAEGEVAMAVIGVFLAVATIVLLITARITELRYRKTFMAEPATLVTHVLHRPWWSAQKRVA